MSVLPVAGSINFDFHCMIRALLAPPLFFFLMIRHPPISPLSPTRPSADPRARCQPPVARRAALPHRSRFRTAPALERSEEHTSELQSQSNLVCRLLLEKKNGCFHASRLHPPPSI